jgi:hypothetical protein
MPKQIAALLTVIVIVFSLSISSCGISSTTPKVVIDKRADKPTKISIDEKQIININSDTTITIELEAGKHTVSVNDSAKQEFTVSDKGGLLNLDNQEYVAYEIKYVASNPSDRFGLDFSDYVVKSTILIDSFIIVPKGPLSKADSALRKILPKLQQAEGNYYSDMVDPHNELFHGLKKMGKGQLFIEKFWNYNMNDTIPQTITIRTSSTFGTRSATRSAILPAKTFLVFAVFNPEMYTVKTIKDVMEGKEDHVKEKELKEKQMDFE